MKAYNEAVGILNSLVVINDDRINLYHKALITIKGNSSYESVFKRMIQQSINYREELSNMKESIGDDTDSENLISLKIYSLWKEVRSNYIGDFDVPSLRLCEYVEGAVQQAYEKALS